jgi:DNA-binding CsgD family transcriptional regulator
MRSDWPSTDEIVWLAFHARSRVEFRAEVLRRVSHAASCEIGIFDSPAQPDELVTTNLDLQTARASRDWWLETGVDFTAVRQAIVRNGVAVDTLLYPERQRECFSYVQLFQRKLGVTSNVMLVWPSGAGAASLVCLSSVGGRISEEQAAACADLVRPLAVADNSLGPRLVRSPFDSWAALHKLSRAQIRVSELVIRGLTNSEIGDVLGCSKHTVRNHLAQVFQLSGVSSRAELVFSVLNDSASNGAVE